MTSSTTPKSLKHLRNYLRLAEDHDEKDKIIAYQSRLYTAQKAIEVDNKQNDDREFVKTILDRLEQDKLHLDNDILRNEQALRQYIEQYTVRLFLKADDLARAGNTDKSLSRSFYSIALLFDICEAIEPLDEQISQLRRVAKLRAIELHTLSENKSSFEANPQTTTACCSQKSNDDADRTELFKQSERFCKIAISALQYDDVKTACDNLENALNVLQPLR